MATMKPGLFPWIKKVVDKDRAGANRRRRVQFTPVQQAVFVEVLRLERRRTERSQKPFMLVLVGSDQFRTSSGGALAHDVVMALSACTRETDLLGWYERDATLGVLMTEIGQADPADISTIVEKLSDALQEAVGRDQFQAITLVFRLFPEDAKSISSKDGDSLLYPDIRNPHRRQGFGAGLKRTMDIAGSILAIAIFLPVMLLIAVLVKATSKGPILFCQKRMGRYGKEFTFFKFRTMYLNNDPEAHREYVTKLIAGGKDITHGKGIYKIVNDPRITALGRILRKTSLDELPQFFNVLRDDMSLVGPRPPLPYEYDRYQTWHRRRVLELKPGITGLWQVGGRSRLNFEEMVRLDLRYANVRSLWLDMKIIVQTPWAMISGRGAC